MCTIEKHISQNLFSGNNIFGECVLDVRILAFPIFFKRIKIQRWWDLPTVALLREGGHYKQAYLLNEPI